MTDKEIVGTLAVKVMGWTWHQRSAWVDQGESNEGRGAWEENNQYRAGRNWNPLTSISDAFHVVEKMRERGWRFLLSADQIYCASFWNDDSKRDGNFDISTDKLCARAICLAAIAAECAGEKK